MSVFGTRTSCDDVVRGLDLSSKVVLVTGCNAGIGFETARSIAQAGARVLLAARTKAKAEETGRRVRDAVPKARVDAVELDLGSLESVRRAVDELPVDALDVAICNAGIYPSAWSETKDGFEETVGVCHVGHFLLVTLLREHLVAAKPSRVVMVSSESHRHPRRLDFDRFPLRREQFRPLVAYGQAKLANVLFANELTRKWQKDGVVGSSLHPGTMMNTSIGRNSRLARVALTIASPFSKSMAEGAATTVRCAVAPDLEGVGGRYYSDCREKACSVEARDPSVARRLWAISEELVQQ